MSCIGCGKVTPLASAVVGGAGYRCQSCAKRVFARASGSFPVVAAPRKRTAQSNELLLIGPVVFALGAVIALSLSWPIGLAAMVVGSFSSVIGFARNKAAR